MIMNQIKIYLQVINLEYRKKRKIWRTQINTEEQEHS